MSLRLSYYPPDKLNSKKRVGAYLPGTGQLQFSAENCVVLSRKQHACMMSVDPMAREGFTDKQHLAVAFKLTHI